MSFRELRRAIIGANNSFAAIEPRAADALCALGVNLAKCERVADEVIAAACGPAVQARGDDAGGAEAMRERAAALASPSYFPAPRGMKTAVVHLTGLITYDIEFQPYAVSTKLFAETMRGLAADETVKSIIMFVDSPGGTVVGLPEAADAVWQARQTKKVTAVVDVLCASAAYYIASQASEITALPSGVGVGSIGVRMMHMECSRAMDAAGISVSHIYSAPYKVEGNQFEPLSEETRARWQLECDTLYMGFLAAVSRGRGIDIKTVKETFGGGRVLMPFEARKVGMIDRLETPRDALGRLGVGAVSASAETPEVTADVAAPEQSSASNDVKTSDVEIVNNVLTEGLASVESPAQVLERERLLLELASY